MPPEIIIADSSSIIILYETELLQLLPSLYNQVTGQQLIDLFIKESGESH